MWPSAHRVGATDASSAASELGIRVRGSPGSASSTASRSSCIGMRARMRGRTFTLATRARPGDRSGRRADRRLAAAADPRPSSSGRSCATTNCWRTGSGRVATSRSSRSPRSPRMIVVEPLFDITSVEVVGEYRLRLTFEDGTVGDVDFTRREWGGVFAPLRDSGDFARVRVDPEAARSRGRMALTWLPSRSLRRRGATPSSRPRIGAD